MPYSQTFPRASMQLLRDHFARPGLHDKHDAAQAAWEVLGFCLWQHSSQRHRTGLLERPPEKLQELAFLHPGKTEVQKSEAKPEPEAVSEYDTDDEPTKSNSPSEAAAHDETDSSVTGTEAKSEPVQKDPAGQYRPLVDEFDKILAQPDPDPRHRHVPQQPQTATAAPGQPTQPAGIGGFNLPPWLAALLAQLIVKVLS
jgi:hypothetical protein